MTGEVTRPNLGLVAHWTPGTSGWAPGMDGDLDYLDAVTFLSVLSLSASTPPGSPTAGDRYIVGASGTGAWTGQAGKVAVYRDSAWAFYTPRLGWACRVQDSFSSVRFDGSVWAPIMQPYDIHASRYKMPVAPEPLFWTVMPRPVSLPLSLVGSKALLSVNPAVGATAATILRNGSSIGSVNFAGSALTGTFTFASIVNFAIDDTFEVDVGTLDPAARGLRLVFVGSRYL